MMKRAIVLMTVLGGFAPLAAADAILTYGPAVLQPGVPTAVTVAVSDGTGVGFGVGSVNLGFTPPPGLSLGGFGWGSGLSTAGRYVWSSSLNSPYTILISAPNPVMIPGAPAGTTFFNVTVTLPAAATPGQQFQLPASRTIKENRQLTVIPSTIHDEDGQPLTNFVFTVVPEPTTLAFLVVGGLLAMRSRRR